MEIAAYGWDHDHWAGDFFPQDLPVEWRLGFYANAYRAVAVPARAWTRLEERDAAGWCADVDDDFRFYLELPANGERLEFAAALGERLGGFLTGSAPAVAEALQVRLGRLAPVCRMAGEGPSCGPGRIAVARCRAGGYAPRELRAAIERLAATEVEGPKLLLFGDEVEAPKAMATARTLMELMGR